MRQRPVDQVGEHGLDDGVPTVGQVCVDGGFGAVGEERVVAPSPRAMPLIVGTTYATNDATQPGNEETPGEGTGL